MEVIPTTNENASRSGTHWILVFDDQQMMRELLETTLQMSGFEVLSARTVAEACAYLMAYPISLVISDWNAQSSIDPGKLLLLKAREKDPLLPVVVISGIIDVDIRTDVLMSGAVSFIQKPFPIGLVVPHVRELIARYRATSSGFRVTDAKEILPLEEVRKRYTQAVIDYFKGNQTEAAKWLGIHRQTIKAIIENESTKTTTNSE